jgi:hypothetical protein
MTTSPLVPDVSTATWPELPWRDWEPTLSTLHFIDGIRYRGPHDPARLGGALSSREPGIGQRNERETSP